MQGFLLLLLFAASSHAVELTASCLAGIVSAVSTAAVKPCGSDANKSSDAVYNEALGVVNAALAVSCGNASALRVSVTLPWALTHFPG